jgi:hypothetical protein
MLFGGAVVLPTGVVAFPARSLDGLFIRLSRRMVQLHRLRVVIFFTFLRTRKEKELYVGWWSWWDTCRARESEASKKISFGGLSALSIKNVKT